MITSILPSLSRLSSPMARRRVPLGSLRSTVPSSKPPSDGRTCVGCKRSAPNAPPLKKKKVLTEYVLVSDTSAVIVTVIGLFKDAVTILVVVLFFGDQFTWLKGIGLATITSGVGLFNWYKYQKLKKGDENREELSLSSSNGTAKYVILDDTESQDKTN